MSVPPNEIDRDIRSNIPEVDPTIDPTKFASQPGVAVADVERLDPPTDIDAATIGDYTPYEAVTGEVSEDATVQGRLSGLLSQDSDYIQRARQNAKMMANRRGMLNSSLAAGAAEGAAIDRALPIAQQDAAAFLEQQFRNQGYSNDAARYLAEQSVTRENLQAGLEQDTRQFNQQNQLETQRLNQAATNQAARDAAAEANKNNFAVLSADLQGQLAVIDNELAMNLEQLAREYSILENLDSINGSIYQQLVAEIGTILANEKKASRAQAKINALIASAGVEFEFSSGQSLGSGGGAGPTAQPVPAPPPPVRTNTGGDRTCFTGDTLVTMEDGSEKPIADVVIGDKLLGMMGSINTVLAYDRPLVGERKIYSFNDGKPFVTAEHPFMTSQGWKSIDPVATRQEGWTDPIKSLTIGDYLEGLGAPLIELVKLEEHDFDPQCPLYNFELSGNHTYYANGYLVHNKQGDGTGPQGGTGGLGGGDGGGGGGGGGGSGGCFSADSCFLMADGTYKRIADIKVGDEVEGGIVTEIRSGLSGRRWFDYRGTHVTDDHFVLDVDDVWKYVKDVDEAMEIDPHEMFYTVNTTNHLLYGYRGAIFTDDAVFDHEHPVWDVEKEQWDDMLDYLNEVRAVTMKVGDGAA